MECGGRVPALGDADAALDQFQFTGRERIQSAVAASLCRRTPKRKSLMPIGTIELTPTFYSSSTCNLLGKMARGIRIRISTLPCDADSTSLAWLRDSRKRFGVLKIYLQQMTLTILVASAAVVFSVISYVLTRRRELAWKRTEFLFSQSQYLEDDPTLVEVITILEDRHPTISVLSVFGDDSNLDQETRQIYKQKFDKLLNFLWRLCYAYLTLKTISSKEVEGFGWYLWRISKIPSLIDYCENNGFEDINTVTKSLRIDQDE
jgi:hypothetical protein